MTSRINNDGDAGGKAVFTSNVIPSKPGLDGSNQIPLGFILSPMSSGAIRPNSTSTIIDSDDSLLTEKDMFLCTTCLAYLNMYCSYDVTNGKWLCPICKSVNAAPKSIFSQSNNNIMKSEIVEYHQEAAGNVNQSPSSEIIMIVLDGNLPPHEAKAILKNLSILIKKKQISGDENNRTLNNVMVGLIIFTSTVHIYQTGLTGIASADIYWIDEEIHDTYDQNYDENNPMNEFESNVMNSKDRMYFGSWDEVQYCASAYFDLLHEDTSKHKHCDLVKESESIKLHHSDDNRTKQKTSRREMLRLKREERLKREKKVSSFDLDDCNHDQAAEFLHEIRKAYKNKTMQQKKRCTGEAIAYALDLISDYEERSTGRILLFTNGSSNAGRGNVIKNATTLTYHGEIIDPEQMEDAAQFFHSIGKEAFRNGIGIDVLCCGNSITLGAQALLALVKPSAGYVLCHSSFDGKQFESNLEYILSLTQMSWTKNQDVNSTRFGLTCSNWMNVIDGCLLDLRMPSYITPISFNGSCTLNNKQKGILPNERSSFSTSASHAANLGISTTNLPHHKIIESTCTSLKMCRFDSKSTVTVMIEINSPIKVNDDESFCYFQFITRFLNPNDKSDLITRVTTQRVPVCTEVGVNFFDSLNYDALSIVLGREAAFRTTAREGRDIIGIGERSTNEISVVSHEDLEDFALQTQQDIDTTVQRILNAYFSQKNLSPWLVDIEQDTDQSQSLTNQYDTAELSSLFKNLHHFRRGNIVGASLQSTDDQSLLRDLFIRLPLVSCLCIMAPLLWMCSFDRDGSIQLHPVPAETLTLWDNVVIAADNFDNLYIWSGKATMNSNYDCLRNRCEKFLKERAKKRFPAPALHFFNEGESMARKLVSLLAPSHGDQPIDQVEHFSKLGDLSTSELQNLRLKFRVYDPKSDATYSHWFNSILSKGSKYTREGISLCE